MSSSQKTSLTNDDSNSPDKIIPKENLPSSPEKNTPKTHLDSNYTCLEDEESQLKLNSGLNKNLSSSTTVENIKKDETIESTLEKSMQNKGNEKMSLDSNDEDYLELRYEDDDLDDSGEILNEDALLEEDTGTVDITEVQQDVTTSIAPQCQVSNILEKIPKIDKKNVDSIAQQIDLEENKKDIEHQSNDSLLMEQNLISNDDNIQLKTLEENMEANTINNKRKSNINPDVSFDRITEHGLNKPDMMLEIPSQELIEFSDEDDEYIDGSTFKMSPDIDCIIDLEENDSDNLIEMEEDNHTEESVESLKGTHMAIVADLEEHADVPQGIVESYKEVITDITENIQIDTTTKALSNEAEIAANFITKEMKGMDDETSGITGLEDTQDQEDSIEELLIPSERDLDKEMTSEFISDDSADVIELSDDNIENEPENIETDSLAEKNAKIVSAIKVAALEKDILNDIEEIDNIILLNKISKTKIKDGNAKESIDFDNSMKTNETISEQNIDVNIPGATSSTESVEPVVTTDKILISLSALKANEVSISHNMKTSPDKCSHTDSKSVLKDEFKGSQEKVSNLNATESNSTFEHEPQSLKTPQSLESIEMKDSATLTDNKATVKSEIHEHSKNEYDLKNQYNIIEESNSSTFRGMGPVISEKDTLTESILNVVEKPMEIDDNQQSMHIELKTSEPVKPATIEKIELKISEIVEPQATVSMIEPTILQIEQQATTTMIEPEISEIVKSQPSSSIETSLMSEKTDPQLLKSKTETSLISEVAQPQPSTSKIEPFISEIVDTQPSTSKTELQVSETIKPQLFTSKTETSITSEIAEPQPSTSKIETNLLSELADPQPSTSKFEPQVSNIVEPQPSTSKCDLENSKTNCPKNQLAFDSLGQDSSNDVPEISDSLGLLAESSRMMVDDEEPDDDDYGEDEDEFELDDESSNQMMADHSEDSNTHQSESAQKDEKSASAEIQEIDFEVTEESKGPEKLECDEEKTLEKPQVSVDAEKSKMLNKIKSAKETASMEVETLKLSDTSKVVNTEGPKERKVRKVSNLLDDEPVKSPNSEYKTWARKKKLSISKQESVMNFVDLGESSSDEEKKPASSETQRDIATYDMSSDAPKDDLSNITKTLQLEPLEDEARSPIGLEVFNLDSDEEDNSNVKKIIENAAKKVPAKKESPPKIRKLLKCINRSCTNLDPDVAFYIPDRQTAKYFDSDKKKRAYVCEKCVEIIEKRNRDLIDGIRNFTPLFQLHTTRNTEELVEISDSDSDEEVEVAPVQSQLVGAEGAQMLTEKLADMLNDTWEKYEMDNRIQETRKELLEEMDRLQKESKDLDTIFRECQSATDKLRISLYATFDPLIQELPSIIIYDMPTCSYSCLEKPAGIENQEPTFKRRQVKRRLSPSKENFEIPAKKSTALHSTIKLEDEDKVENVDDDNMEISVVQLSVETAPADLPPPGDLSHPPIKLGMTVYAMKNAFGTWLRAKVVEIQPKAHNIPFTMVRVRFEHKVTKNPFKTLPARCLAYFEPSDVRMTIGTRVIALFKDISMRQAYYSGIVAEIPNPVNNYRYLIFFDDGYAQYATHSQTRLVCEFSSLVWEEVHPYSREFVRSYLLAYPERPMVRLHAGQNLKTEWRGKWWSSRVVNVDASLVEVQFLRCDRREWIYRGSTRLAPLYLELQAAERHRPRALPRTQPQARVNMPYVEYTRLDEQANKQAIAQRQQQNEEIRRQRAVAKKSTVPTPQPQSVGVNAAGIESAISRVVFYTPKSAVKPHKMTPHACSPSCKRNDVLTFKDLRTYNPLTKPLLSGWERQIVRGRGLKQVMYVAPCGRRLRNFRELHRYLRSTESDMPVDLFDFSPITHCLAEFVINKCFVGKKDLSHGKEIVPVPCVNCYDDSLPEFCSYNTERTPTAGVPLNLDPEFLCGCDCEDDCEDKTKCACWKMTLEGARTIGYDGDVGYVYRRLPEPLPSGIYECNSRCKCKSTCLNRVAQHPLQLKLQVFKTLNRGWGIRALNDVPKGAFLCVYAGNLLTDATANLDGLNEGDEYLAELDYIEVVEQMKEGYEEDIPDKIKTEGMKGSKIKKEMVDEDDEESSEDEISANRNDQEDDDFVPVFSGCGLGVTEFNKRLRRRDSKKEEDVKPPVKEKEANPDEDCITISDDEEVREPSCFTAAAGMGKNQFISKYRSVRSLFGEDEACYIMDAKVQGNIGRYLNHSCTPNVFVQNVFVDTHDPRFPWVAFFALHHIRAGTELTWNYNYDVGSVPGKVLYCFCGATNCRGRLL